MVTVFGGVSSILREVFDVWQTVLNASKPQFVKGLTRRVNALHGAHLNNLEAESDWSLDFLLAPCYLHEHAQLTE